MSDRIPLNEASAAAANKRRRLAEAEQAATAELSPSLSADLGPDEAADLERRRRTRKPFGSREQKLIYPDRPGYHRHWFNDEPGRLLRAEEAGYSQVHGPDGKPVSTVVGVSRGGGALVAFLHEIPAEWYAEDMAAQEQVVLDLKQQIKTGQIETAPGMQRDDIGKIYAGSKTMGDISIRESTRR